MLVIVMHNNSEYLEYIRKLAKGEGITEATIIARKGIGTRLIGGDASFVFSRGRMLDAYDKALVVSVRGEEKTKQFLELIESDDYLDRLNIQTRGFICAVPFHYITHFELEAPPGDTGNGDVKIGDFLKQDRIALNIKAHDKREAIKELAAVLRGAPEITDFGLFLKDVFERETLGTTAIGNGVAIPHARTSSVKEFVIAVGRPAKGVDFGALDNSAVNLIFLMGTPKEKRLSSYLKILAHLTRLLQKEGLRKELLRAQYPRDIIEAFRKIEVN